MAAAYVPPPPDDELLDPLLLSQTVNSKSYQVHRQPAIHSNYGYKQSAYPAGFGGDAFYDSAYFQQQGSRALSQHSLQTVPFTPATRQPQQCWTTPSTEDLRLDFTYDDPTTATGKSTIGLRSVTEIPERYRSVFSQYSHFNLVQSKVFDDVMYTDTPMVVSAPTGSGKTVLFELAIIRLMMQLGENISQAKIVYVAPIKALCSERHEDWQTRFGPLGLHCSELTGDTQLDDYFELKNAQIIMTTPEKWDSITRRWRDNQSLVQLVRLFLIDEIHQLNDETRGPTVEAIVSRMKTIRSSLAATQSAGGSGDGGPMLRFMAISATIPNIEDVAAWLGTEDHPAVSHCIDESHRPVQLHRVVLGYPDATTDFKFNLSLNYKLGTVIHSYSEQKPTLVFCATRKGTQQAAQILVKDARFILNAAHKRRLQSVASGLKESKLRELLVYGVGYHHAGVETGDRKAVESLFTSGELPVLFSTSTLAMGVNLPAHLVVIKSTLHYVGGGFQEYTESQILQMIGRAGRPQFDTTATVVIMTRNSTKRKYEALLGGTQLVESNLHANLIEHLCAEIVLHTITDVSIALDWLKSTFLYIRIKKNPIYYKIPEDLKAESLEEKLQEMCLKDLNLLEDNGLITIQEGFILSPTETGKMMARYCVAFESMKLFLSMKGDEKLGDLVETLSKCREFDDIHLRVNEKRTLNTLNRDKTKLTVRFPMPGKIKSTDMKVSCLMQATLGCLPVQEFALNQDTQKIFRAANRLAKCLMELQWLSVNYRCQLNAILLHKCAQARLWENSRYVSKQLDKIGVTLSTVLVNAGYTTFDKLLEANPRELELVVNRHPPFGNQVKDAVKKLPRYSLSIEQSPSLSSHQADITANVHLINYTLLKELPRTNHTVVLLIGDSDNNVCIKHKIMHSQLLHSGVWSKRVTVLRSVTSPHDLHCHLISLEYVGLDVEQTFTPQYTISSMPPPRPPTNVGVSSSEPNTMTDTTTSSSKGKASSSASGKTRYRPCSHRCINKTICGHECCKYGLTLPPPVSPSPIQNKAASTVVKLAATTPKPRTGSISSTQHIRQPKSNSAMKSHMSELHARVQSIPPTPHLKRLKVSSSDYRDYVSPSTMQQKYSYAPLKEKLKRNYASSNLSSSSSSYSTPSTSGSMPSSSSGIQSTKDDFSCEENYNDDLQFLSMDDFCDFENEWDEGDSVPQIVPDSAAYCSNTSSRLTTAITQYQSTLDPSPKQAPLPPPVKCTSKSSSTTSFLFQAPPQSSKVLSNTTPSVYTYSTDTLPPHTQRKRSFSSLCATEFEGGDTSHLFSAAGVSTGAPSSAPSPAKRHSVYNTTTASTSQSPAWIKPVPQRPVASTSVPSFFTAGPINPQDDDQTDLFDNVFADIF